MAFDLEGAKKAGYTDAEIAQHLSQESGFDYKGAVSAGYGDAEVIKHLSGTPATTKPPKPSTPPKDETGREMVNRHSAWDLSKAVAEKHLLEKVDKGGLMGLTPGGAAGSVGMDMLQRIVGLIPEGGGKELLDRLRQVPVQVDRSQVEEPVSKGMSLAERLKGSEYLQTEGGLHAPTEVDPRLVTGEVLDPSNLAELGVGAAAFPREAQKMGTRSVLDALGVAPVTEEGMETQTLGEFAGEWSEPYQQAFKGNFGPLARRAVEDPEQTLMDLAIFFGLVKGGIKQGQGAKTRQQLKKRLKEREELIKESKEATEGKEGAKKTRTPDSIEEIMLDAGIPAESMVEAQKLLDRVPAYVRKGPKEVPKPAAVEAPPELVGKPVTPTREGPLPQLGAEALTPKRTGASKTLEAAGESQRSKRTGVQKTAEDRLRETREPVVPEKKKTEVEVIPDKYGRLEKEVEAGLEELIRPKGKGGREFITRKARSQETPPLVPAPRKRKVIQPVPPVLPNRARKLQTPMAGEKKAVKGVKREAASKKWGTGKAGEVKLKGIGLATEFDGILAKEMVRLGGKDFNKIMKGAAKDPKASKELEMRARESLREKGIVEFADEVGKGKVKKKGKAKAPAKKKTPAQLKHAQAVKARKAKKGKDEAGAIGSRRTATEKRFYKAMANYRKAVKAEDARVSAVKAGDLPSGYKGESGEALSRSVGAAPETAKKLRKTATHEEYWVAELNSPTSEASVNYRKSGNFDDYVSGLPSIGEAKPREVRGQAGVVDVRKNGNYVHVDFMKQFVEIRKNKEGKDVTRMLFKDVPANWEWTTDPGRFIEWSDKAFGGQLAKKMLRPARDGLMAGDHWAGLKEGELAGIAERNGIKGKKDARKVGQILLGEKVKASARIRKAAEEIKALQDTILTEMNKVRKQQGREEIPRRDDYGMAWMVEQTMRDKLFGRRTKPEWIMEKSKPFDSIDPNAPFNPRELPREAQYEKYVKEKDAIKVVLDYIQTGKKDIFYSNIIQNNKVHAKALGDVGMTNLSNGIMRWTSEVFAGRRSKLDFLQDVHPVIANGLLFQRHLKKRLMGVIFPLNVPWNTFRQTSSTAMLIPQVGLTNSIKGLQVFVDPALQKFVESTYTHVQKGKSRVPGAVNMGELGKEYKILDRRGSLDKATDLLNVYTRFMEKHLTDHAIAAGYFEGKRMGLSGRDLHEFASDVGARAHSMYNVEDLPALQRSKDLTATFPLQTFAWEAMNNIRGMGGKRGKYAADTTGKSMVRLLKWYAALEVANYLSEEFTGNPAWTLVSPIPYGAALLSAFDVDVKGGRYDAYKPTIAKWIGDGRKAAADAVLYDDWTSTRRFVNSWITPGGVQVERAAAAEEARRQRGMVKSSSGQKLYRVRDDEWMKAYLLGPSKGSKAGRQRGAAQEKTLLEVGLGKVIPEGTRSRTLRRMRKDKLRRAREVE